MRALAQGRGLPAIPFLCVFKIGGILTFDYPETRTWSGVGQGALSRRVEIEPWWKMKISTRPYIIRAVFMESVGMRTRIRKVVLGILWLSLIPGLRSAAVPSGPEELLREFVLRIEQVESGRNAVPLSPIHPAAYRLRAERGRIIRGSLPKARSAELTEDHLVVLGLNARGEELGRVALIDPRIIRAEWADEEGRLTGRILFHSLADFTVFFPAALEIVSVRILVPKWTGNGFDFQALGEIPVSARGADGTEARL